MALIKKMAPASLRDAAQGLPAVAARFQREELLRADGGFRPPEGYDYRRGFYKFGWQSLGPGERVKRHTGIQAEFYLFLTGQGTMYLAGETFDVAEGDVIYLPPTSEREVVNRDDATLEYLWVGIPFVA